MNESGVIFQQGFLRILEGSVLKFKTNKEIHLLAFLICTCAGQKEIMLIYKHKLNNHNFNFSININFNIKFINIFL